MEFTVPAMHPATDGASMIFVIAGLAILAGVFLSAIAVYLYARLADARRTAQRDRERAKHQIDFRDALLCADGEAVVVLGQDFQTNLAGESPNGLLKIAIDGPDGRRVATAFAALLQEGREFRLVARSQDLQEAIAIRGKTVRGRPVVFARSQGAAIPAIDFHTVLDGIAVPVWVRGPDTALRWSNRAFSDTASATGLQRALISNSALQRSELDMASAAIEGANIDAVRFALVDGERRAFSMKYTRLPDGAVAGTAVDITEKAQAEGKLRLHLEATADMLDGLPIAIAVFDGEQRLQSFNAAYAKTWSFAEDWLETHPTHGDVLDRLRETRQLPEQHDYALWKAGQLGLFEGCARRCEDYWHLAGGRSFRVVTSPHLQGGLVVTVEDVSESLRLKASLQLLTQVQRATIDAVEDGLAIFGPDGRLMSFNRSFSSLWHFDQNELADQPHFTKVARLAESRIGHDGIWSMVAAGIASNEPQRCNEWGKTTRADGRVMSLSMTRLPNGATMAMFHDLTDIVRFQELTGTSHAAA